MWIALGTPPAVCLYVDTRSTLLMRSPPHFHAAWKQLGEAYYAGERNIRTRASIYCVSNGLCVAAETTDGRAIESAIGLRLIGWLPPEGSSESMRLSPDFHGGWSAVFWRENETPDQDSFVFSSPAHLFRRAGADAPVPPKSTERPLCTEPDSLTRIHVTSKVGLGK